jgi:hypothetical protein
MLRKSIQVRTRQNKLSFKERREVVRQTCLLCRILWPMLVQHRHVLFDGVRKQRRPFMRRCTPEDSPSAAMLVFDYSEEISIDGPLSS